MPRPKMDKNTVVDKVVDPIVEAKEVIASVGETPTGDSEVVDAEVEEALEAAEKQAEEEAKAQAKKDEAAARIALKAAGWSDSDIETLLASKRVTVRSTTPVVVTAENLQAALEMKGNFKWGKKPNGKTDYSQDCYTTHIAVLTSFAHANGVKTEKVRGTYKLNNVRWMYALQYVVRQIQAGVPKNQLGWPVKKVISYAVVPVDLQ